MNYEDLGFCERGEASGADRVGRDRARRAAAGESQWRAEGKGPPAGRDRRRAVRRALRAAARRGGQPGRRCRAGRLAHNVGGPTAVSAVTILEAAAVSRRPAFGRRHRCRPGAGPGGRGGLRPRGRRRGGQRSGRRLGGRVGRGDRGVRRGQAMRPRSPDVADEDDVAALADAAEAALGVLAGLGQQCRRLPAGDAAQDGGRRLRPGADRPRPRHLPRHPGGGPPDDRRPSCRA